MIFQGPRFDSSITFLIVLKLFRFTPRIIDHLDQLVESPQQLHDREIWNAPWLGRCLETLPCMKNNDRLPSNLITYAAKKFNNLFINLS